MRVVLFLISGFFEFVKMGYICYSLQNLVKRGESCQPMD